MCDSGKRKVSDSDSYDDDDGAEGSLSSEMTDSTERELIAASQLSTQVRFVVTI